MVIESKHQIAICGELALEEATDLSKGELRTELMVSLSHSLPKSVEYLQLGHKPLLT